MTCAQGTIYLAEYPYTDRAGSKVRPVLAVSSNRYNEGDDAVVLPISSAPDPDDPFAIYIPSDAPWFQQTGLKRASSIKWTKPMTVTSAVLGRRLGTVPPQCMDELRRKLADLFS